MHSSALCAATTDAQFNRYVVVAPSTHLHHSADPLLPGLVLFSKTRGLMTRTLRLVVAVLVLFLSFSHVSYGQPSRGEIDGRVTDSSGAVLQGAMISVVPGGLHTVTDANGGY